MVLSRQLKISLFRNSADSSKPSLASQPKENKHKTIKERRKQMHTDAIPQQQKISRNRIWMILRLDTIISRIAKHHEKLFCQI